MAWVTSNLYHQLETTDLLLPGKCIVRDNAYVKKKYMTVPIKGILGNTSWKLSNSIQLYKINNHLYF